MFNQVTLCGYVGGNPVKRYTTGGTAVANFSLATRDFWRGKDNEEHHETDWHRCTVWGRLAEVAESHIEKGNKLIVSGKLKYGEYTKDGRTIRYAYIHVTEMKFVEVSGPGTEDMALAVEDRLNDEPPF